MKRAILLIALLVAISLSAIGREIVATVYDQEGRRLDGISVMGLANDSTLLRFTLTDSAGRFALEGIGSTTQGEALTDSVVAILKFSGLGYESVYMRVGEDVILPEKIELKSRDFELKEVVVSAPESYQNGDTINFNVSSFSAGTDHKVIDVLKKLPGITVNDDGKVEFNGKRISNMYVEGLNLAGSQYEQITNGVNSDDISTVQILQNNQPVKMLRGVVPSDQVDINLKIKEGRKDIWALNTEAGGGWLAESPLTDPLSYGIGVNPMRFGKVRQSLSSLLLTDNQIPDGSDSDLTSEIRQSSEYMTALSLLRPALRGNLHIPISRQHGITQESLKTNWIKGSNETATTRLSIGVSHASTVQATTSDKEFVTIEGNPQQILEERNEDGRYRSYVEAEYRTNASDRFVTFTTRSVVERDGFRNRNILNGTSRNDRQRFVNFTTDNQLSYKTLLKNRNILDFNATASYTILNTRMSVVNHTSLSKVGYQDGSFNLSTAFLVKLSGIRMTWATALTYAFKELESSLGESNSFADHKLGLRLSPGVDYTFKGVRLSLSLPIDLQYREYGGRRAYALLPGGSLFVNYRPNSFWQVSLNGLYSMRQNGFFDLVPLAIYTSFDSQRRGSGILTRSNDLSSTLNLTFTDMIRGYSAYLRTNLLYISKSPLVRSVLENETSLMETTELCRPTATLSSKAQISKRFPKFNTLVSLTGSVGYTRGHTLSGSEIYPMEMKNQSLRLKLSATPWEWLSLESAGEVSSSSQCFRRPLECLTSKVSSYSLQGKWSIILGRLIWSSEVTLMKNSLPNSPVLHLYDMELSYKWRRYEVGITCENLLDNREYRRKYMSLTLNTTYTTLLRPRQLMATWRINL